jgi:hypothetical protein
MKLVRGTKIVLDRVPGPHHFDILEAGNGAEKGVLDLDRQTGGAAVDIIFVGVATLGFEEDLVTFFIGEADNLIFEGRAIARANSFDLSAVERAFIEVGPDDIGSLRGGVGDVTGNLFHVKHSVLPVVERKDVVFPTLKGFALVAKE